MNAKLTLFIFVLTHSACKLYAAAVLKEIIQNKKPGRNRKLHKNTPALEVRKSLLE